MPNPPTLIAATPAVEQTGCPSCGAPGMHAFCPHCGERRAAEADYSLRGFLGEALETVTNLDTRVGRTAHALLLRPGLLSASHFEGVRRPYLGPLQLFLLCNVLFFFLQTLFGIGLFTLTLDNALVQFNGLFLDFAARDGMTFRELRAADPEAFAAYATEFQRAASTQARTLVLAMVPFFAAVSYLLYGRDRRYYAQHLVFSLHTYAFLMLTVAATALAFWTAVQGARATASPAALTVLRNIEGVLPSALMLLFGIHIALSARRALGGGHLATLLKAIALLGGWFVILVLYRGVLFLVTIRML